MYLQVKEGIEERLSCMDTESNTSCLQSMKRAVANNWKWWPKRLSIILASHTSSAAV